MHPDRLCRTVFLDHERGVLDAVRALAGGEPIIEDFGATFGIAFDLAERERVAMLRKETRQPDGRLDTVSIVSTHDYMIGECVAVGNVHPWVRPCIERGDLTLLEQLVFLQLPASDQGKRYLGPHYISDTGIVQVFLVPASRKTQDVVMELLEAQFGRTCLGVRSANIHNEREATTAWDAEKLAKATGIGLLARLREDDVWRERVGSQPSLVIPTKDDEPVITIFRTGNTGERTLRSFAQGIFGSDIPVVKQEAKPTPPWRRIYDVPDDLVDPKSIRDDLLKASGLLETSP